MANTTNLGMPYIDAGQAQKHVTHNEALRILDAAVQIAVLDITRNAPPPSLVDGQRHAVAGSPTGAWAGQARAIATWQDGAWAFLAPKPGWCIWSVADGILMVFDGSVWRDARNLSFDNIARLGINTGASGSNLFSLRSNAALFAAIAVGDGGSGDARLQMSKEAAGQTASVVFSNNYSGRAEFGLIGSDSFRLKVSPDGSGWVDALSIDPASGAATLPRALVLAGIVTPAQLTANQNDYAPAGSSAATVLQLSSDTTRSLTGLGGGLDGRLLSLVNVGSQNITLLDESTASAAANRFALGTMVIIAPKQAMMLRYDALSSRWQALARPLTIAVAPQGRLTLQSGSPVMSGAQLAKSTLYYTPACGNQLTLYDGLNLQVSNFLELPATTTDATKSPAAIGPNKVNDWFVWSDAGTLRLSHGPDWTSDTVRSAGTALSRIRGLLLNAVAITNGPPAFRGTYVGTTRSDAASLLNWSQGGSAAGGSAALLHVWNAFNRVSVAGSCIATASSLYTSATIRPFAGSAGMQVGFVIGLGEEALLWSHSAEALVRAVAGAYAITGVGFDTTAAFSAPRVIAMNQSNTATLFALEANAGSWSPSAGAHVLSFNQQGDGAGSNEFNNVGNATLSAALQM